MKFDPIEGGLLYLWQNHSAFVLLMIINYPVSLQSPVLILRLLDPEFLSREATLG